MDNILFRSTNMKKMIKFVFWTTIMTLICCINVGMQLGIQNALLARCRHLEGYSYFRNYNRNHSFDSFLITEAWEDGEAYYKLIEPKEKITCMVNQEQTEARVDYLGKTVTFPIGGFLNTNANVYLTDLTNDGFHEFLYEETVNGGERNASCVVVELKEMKVLELKDYSDSLLDKVSIEKVREEDGQTLCKVTDDNHHIYFGSMEGRNAGEKSTKIGDCRTIEYDYASGKLRAYVCFTLSGYEKKAFLGDISAYYVYDPQSETFRLEDKYSVSLWNPQNISSQKNYDNQ